MYINKINATSQLDNQSEKDESALNEMIMYAIFISREKRNIYCEATKNLLNVSVCMVLNNRFTN